MTDIDLDDAIEQLPATGTVVSVDTRFADLLDGSFKGAIMLSQAVYWQKDAHKSAEFGDAQGWWYHDQPTWEARTGLDPDQQRRVRRRLRSFDWWHEARRGMPARLHYHVDLVGLAEELSRPEADHTSRSSADQRSRSSTDRTTDAGEHDAREISPSKSTVRAAEHALARTDTDDQKSHSHPSTRARADQPGEHSSPGGAGSAHGDLSGESSSGQHVDCDPTPEDESDDNNAGAGHTANAGRDADDALHSGASGARTTDDRAGSASAAAPDRDVEDEIQARKASARENENSPSELRREEQRKALAHLDDLPDGRTKIRMVRLRLVEDWRVSELRQLQPFPEQDTLDDIEYGIEILRGVEESVEFLTWLVRHAPEKKKAVEFDVQGVDEKILTFYRLIGGWHRMRHDPDVDELEKVPSREVAALREKGKAFEEGRIEARAAASDDTARGEWSGEEREDAIQYTEV